MKTLNQTHTKGFSLIELMIVVAIIGILSALAYPSYRDYVMQSNRTAAQACMLEISQFMERDYSTNFSYVGLAIPAMQCVTDTADQYAYSLTGQAARTYQVVATPTAIQQDGCGVLLLNQAGQKGAKNSYTPENVAGCW